MAISYREQCGSGRGKGGPSGRARCCHQSQAAGIQPPSHTRKDPQVGCDVRINARRNSAHVNMQNIVTMCTMLMRGALSTGECFLECKEFVRREMNLKYFGLERTLAYAKARYVRQGRLLPEI